MDLITAIVTMAASVLLWTTTRAPRAAEPARVEPELQPPPAPPAENPNRIPSYHKPRRKVMEENKCADLFIAFMNGEGLTGLFAASELDDYWELCCELHDIVHIDIRLVRAALAEKGLGLGLKRLKTSAYATVRERTGKDRAVLYRIPRSRGKAGLLPDAPELTPDQPRIDRQAVGTTPAGLPPERRVVGHERVAA